MILLLGIYILVWAKWFVRLSKGNTIEYKIVIPAIAIVTVLLVSGLAFQNAYADHGHGFHGDHALTNNNFKAVLLQFSGNGGSVGYMGGDTDPLKNFMFANAGSVHSSSWNLWHYPHPIANIQYVPADQSDCNPCHWDTNIVNARNWINSHPDTKVVLAGYSFGGGAATYVGDDVKASHKIEGILLTDPVGSGAGAVGSRTGIKHYCSTSFPVDSGCNVVAKGDTYRLIHENIKGLFIGYQKQSAPPDDIGNDFDDWKSDGNFPGVFDTKVHFCASPANCHSQTGSNVPLQTEFINHLKSLNKKPILSFDSGINEYDVPEGGTLNLVLHTEDPHGVKETRADMHLDVKIDSLTAGIEHISHNESLLSTGIKAITTFDLDFVGSDGPSTQNRKAWVQDNGWPCDNCSNIPNSIDSGATGKWDSADFTINIINVPPTPELISGPLLTQNRINDFTFNAIDPSPADQAAGFKYVVTWWDGTKSKIDTLTVGDVTFTSPPLTQVGESTFTVTAEDKDGDATDPPREYIVIVSDIDGDGIADAVDVFPAVFSDDFDDVPIGGETDGTIDARGDQGISILEEANPDGIFFNAGNTGGAVPAKIIACNNTGELTIDSGDSGTIKCGSITVSIISGSVDVKFFTNKTPATTTMGPADSLTFDRDGKTLTFTNNSLTTPAIITIGGRTFSIPPGETLTYVFPSHSVTYQDPNLGDVRHGTGHDNGFCMNQNCINVDGFFNHFPETIVPQGSTQTFSLLINCPRGVDTCNHASIEGVLPDSEFYDEQWGVTLDRLPRSDTWETTINNPYGEISDVTTTVQEVGQSFLSVSYSIKFQIPGSIGTADGLDVAHENNRHLHVTVWDNNRGMSNYIFNEGVYVDDIYAYPQLEMSFDPSLEYEPLCLNEDSTKRYTCAFDKVKDWTIEKAEKALLEINGKNQLDVLETEFLLKFKEHRQAITDGDSEKITELRKLLDELGARIYNMKQ